MKQVYQNFSENTLGVYEVPSPTLRSGTVLIKNAASVISVGTEGMVTEFGSKNLFQKARSRPDLVKQVLSKIKTDGLFETFHSARAKLDQPIALGYSSAGIAEYVSEEIQDIHPGDRLACAGGGYASHAEKILVPRNLLIKVPDDVKLEEAAFSTIGSIAMQGYRLSNPQIGDVVAVIGLGLIGLITVQILKAAGCRVIAYDPKNVQVNLANELGADVAVNNESLFKKEATLFNSGFGIDRIIITASTKSDQPIQLSSEIAMEKTKIVVVGAVGMNISRKLFYEKELELIVSKSYGPGRYDPQYEEKGIDYPISYIKWTENRNMISFIELVHSGKINLKKLISHKFSIEQATKAYELISPKSKQDPVGIILTYPNDTGNAKKIFSLNKKTGNFKKSKIKVGVIGAGNFASRFIIPEIKSNVHKVGLCSYSSVASSFKANKFDFDYCTTDPTEVIKDKNINTVIISTRHSDHGNLVIKSLEAGKNVYVDKPLALSLKEIDSIEKSLAVNSKILMVGFNRRFSPFTMKIKELLQLQSSPFSITMTINAGHIDRKHWINDKEIGGGRIIGEVCHFIDLLRFLSASPIKNFSAQFLSENPKKDVLTIVMKFMNGSIGNINYFSNGNKNLSKERLELYCNGGVLQLDNFRKLSSYGWPGFSSMNSSRQDKGHKNQIKTFLKSIQNGYEAPIPIDEILEVARATIDISNL